MRNNTLVIIPAYNEEKSLSFVVENIRGLNADLDIVVIDDGSKDKTSFIARNLSLKVISHPFNLGYGAALLTGYRYALKYNYDYVVQIDADGQHSAEDIITLLGELKNKKCDVVIGSRYITKKVNKINLVKRFVNNLFSFIIYFQTKVRIKDTTSGFKVLNKKVLELYVNDFFSFDYPDADIIIYSIKRNIKYLEVPIKIRNSIRPSHIHGGLKPVYYLFKMFFSVLVLFFLKRGEAK